MKKKFSKLFSLLFLTVHDNYFKMKKKFSMPTSINSPFPTSLAGKNMFINVVDWIDLTRFALMIR